MACVGMSAAEYLPEVYAELRRLARGYLSRTASGATLQPTALVHEAYLQLSQAKQPGWTDRTHFLGVAALAMRQVLAQHYRRGSTLKRGARARKLDFPDDLAAAGPDALDFGDLEEALARLEAEAPELSRVVELRFFGGLSVEECAEFLGISTATVKRRWRLARVWLYRELND
jgi:RNA polymerase sigma factor (TIGR02999 family)